MVNLGPGTQVLRAFGLLSIHLSIACSLLISYRRVLVYVWAESFLSGLGPLSIPVKQRLLKGLFLELSSPDRTTSSTFSTHSPLWRRVPHHELPPCASREIGLPLPGPQSRRHQARPGDSSIQTGRKEMNKRECWHIHNLITTGEHRPVLSFDQATETDHSLSPYGPGHRRENDSTTLCRGG